MKEVVVISGKGGTGKTSLTSSFAFLGGKQLVIGDCDVDADDMHLLLAPDYYKSEDFFSGFEAQIDNGKCIQCGKCAEVCRFHAVSNEGGFYKIDEIGCEGCGYCAEVCPTEAIDMLDSYVGNIFESTIKTGASMIHARLRAGADNSGKLVARVKQDARKKAQELGINMIIIDGSPGIGCPVISSITGADYVILVTEPTPSGLHDLKRVYELVKKFKIKAGLIINKYDLNSGVSAEIKKFADTENISLIAELPYNEDFTKAITAGKTVAEYEESIISKIVKEAWTKAENEINRG